MDWTVLLAGIVMVLVVVYLIGRPFLQAQVEESGLDLGLEEEQSLERRKESVFTTLGEIEFDYQMRKLSEEDYRQLKNEYQSEAVAVLKEEESEELEEEPMARKRDRLAEGKLRQELEAEIDRDLAALRGGTQGDGD